MVEGARAVAEALDAEANVKTVFVSVSFKDAHDLRTGAVRNGARVVEVGDDVIHALSDTTTPQGIVAVAAVERITVLDLPQDISLVVVLCAVRDPGNAGTLIRSAVAAGADAVVFAGGAVDPFSPKTVRASAGTLWHLPVIVAVQARAALIALRDRGMRIVGTSLQGPPAAASDLTTPVGLVLGNEAWGLDSSLADLVDESVTIPMPGPAESLNVGIAGSVLLFEAVRQRAGMRPA